MKYARRRDVNERAIIDELERAGYAVQQLDGSGVPDLLVGLGEQLWLVEVKHVGEDRKRAHAGRSGDTAGLTPAQVKWWAKWKGPAPKIVTTAAEALAAIGAKK